MCKSCSFEGKSTKNSVIPVRDTGIYLIFIMDMILTYVPRICCPLHNLQMFLCPDPVSRTGMTRVG
ncbi:MAG: hypothetical protein ACEY3L_15415 [Wolbachia sp.]